MADVTERKRRSGGRAGNTRRTSSEVIQQAPWIVPVNTDRPTEPLNEEGVEAIHNGAMRILEEIGIDFLNEEALELFKEIGVKVNGSNVRMDREWVMEMVAKAPSEFHDHAAQSWTVKSPSAGATWCSGMSRRRRIILILRRGKFRERVSNVRIC